MAHAMAATGPRVGSTRAATPANPPHSSAPAVQIKPEQQDEIMDLCIRYITTAAGRATRRGLYGRVYPAQAAAGC